MNTEPVMLVTSSPEETKQVAARLATLLRPNDVLGLCGVLGAGKTCFVKGLARGLGVAEEDRVSSPTFVLMKRHEGTLTLYHFDAYRLGSASEMEAIGCEDIYHMGGISVIEWADRVRACLPQQHFLIQFIVTGENERELAVSARGAESTRRLKEFGSVLAPWRLSGGAGRTQ